MTDASALDNGLEPIEPMVQYYAREMGQMAGRLMAAMSLLVDLEDGYGWNEQGKQARDTVHYSRLLVASVLRIIATAQLEQDGEMDMGKAIDAYLQQFNRGTGGETP